MKTRLFGLFGLTLVLMLAPLGAMRPPVAEAQTVALVKGRVGAQVQSTIFLPLITKGCTTTTGIAYASGTAYQQDGDNPVRPAWNHADKNLDLRGYNLDLIDTKGLVRVNPDPLETKQPPQFATFFNPYRVPVFSNVYRVNDWTWGADSTTPGTRGTPVTSPPVTVVGFQTAPGEQLRVPISDYDIGGGMEVIVLFADTNSITFKYTREDSTQPNGYTLHVDNICTDTNLLALYNQLDSPSGPRYQFHSTGFHTYSYNLPNLPAGQVFGTAFGTEIRVAIVDTGAFLEPRACTSGGRHWWEVGGGVCPP